MMEHNLTLTAQIVSAYLSNNRVQPDEIKTLLIDVHTALTALQSFEQPQEPVEPQKPAVPVKRSVTPDYIICLEDGKKLKMLKRHLSAEYGMTPAEYRAKWGLPADYPMTAPNYAARRSEFARQIGLGRTAA